MLRQWFLVLLALAVGGGAAAQDALLRRYDRVEIAPTKTSVYVANVTMTISAFTRKAGIYEATYAAEVFPFFFYNEQGRLFIEVSDDALRRLARGEPLDFTGHGVNTSGKTRHIDGRAVPLDATKGTIKVRVFITKRIQLVFNTTYRFGN